MEREIELAFIKLHILHHAAEEEVFGLGLIEELARHGYALSPGTLYPVLAKLCRQNLLSVTARVVNHKQRKYYRTTPEGDALLAGLRRKVAELSRELLDEGHGS